MLSACWTTAPALVSPGDVDPPGAQKGEAKEPHSQKANLPVQVVKEIPMPEFLARKTVFKPGTCLVEGCMAPEDRRGVCKNCRTKLGGLFDRFALPPQRGRSRREMEVPPLRVELPNRGASVLAGQIAQANRPPQTATPVAVSTGNADLLAPPVTPDKPAPLEGLSDAQIGAMAREGLRVLGRTAAGGNFAGGEEGEDSEEEEEALAALVLGIIPVPVLSLAEPEPERVTEPLTDAEPDSEPLGETEGEPD
jgi:hypothetical protein